MKIRPIPIEKCPQNRYIMIYFGAITYVLTLHIYCFYIYASKLYKLSNSLIKNLYLLFKGKKHNPLRNNRIDSCYINKIAEGGPNSGQINLNFENKLILQRTILSSLLFCITLLLWPTFLVYYLVCCFLNFVCDWLVRGPVKFLFYLVCFEFESVFRGKGEMVFEVSEAFEVGIANMRLNVRV